MTESIRRDGDHQKHSNDEPRASVDQDWPPPPPYPPAYAMAGAGPYAERSGPATSVAPAGPGGPGGGGGVGASVPGPPGRGRRGRAAVGMLAAVAAVAALVGGGTAYGVQELAGGRQPKSEVTTSTPVVPSAERGTVAGVARAVSPSIVEIQASTRAGASTGSGVIITADGEIVTNDHVISGASTLEVTTDDGRKYTADVVGTDPSKDLALIKLRDASGLKPATLGNSSQVQVGDQVVAIGSPEGLTGTVTSGIVSALDRDVTVSVDDERQQSPGDGWPFRFDGRDFNGDTGDRTTTYKAIQTDASLNPGNSGGALIDMNGHVIGINSAMYAPTSLAQASAGSVGLGFAIPIDTVKADLDQLRSGGTSD